MSDLEPIIDELTYRSYAHNRMLSPHITLEQWALVYPNVPDMERRYLMTFVLAIMAEAPEEREQYDA